MRRAIAILLHVNLILQPVLLKAQQYPFVHYTPKEGLISARARSMFQDSRGRLYVCTFGGLSIYDGARFTNYTMKNGLANNMVNEVVEIASDSILVFPNVRKFSALVHGNLKEVTTVDGFCPVVNKMIKANDGSYYAFADEGLFSFSNNRFKRMPIEKQGEHDINRFFIKGIELDGKILIVTDPAMGAYPSPSFLIIYDIKTHRTCISAKPPEVYDVAISPKGEILVCTNQGLKLLDKDAMNEGQVSLLPPPQAYGKARNNIASTLYFDKQHNLWLALGDEVLKIDEQGLATHFSIETGLLVNRQYSFFQDSEGTMWFVNQQTGISKLTNQQFEYYGEIKPGFKASDLYADVNSDSVWFFDAINKKLLVQSPTTTKEISIQSPPHWVFTSIPTQKSSFLTGFFEIYRYDPVKEKPVPHLVYSNRDSLTGVAKVNFPTTDNRGNLLFSNEYINVLLGNNKVVSFPMGYFGDQFTITADNYLWIVNRENKLFLFRIHPDKGDKYFELIKVYDSVVNGGARSVTLDEKNNVWIGTRDMGLFAFTVGDQWKLTLQYHFTNKSGLSDNCILSLHTDQNGNVWACSPVGLDKIQERNGKWVVENMTRGNNIYQDVIKVNTTRSGDHWVLTRNGIIKIRPSVETPPVTYHPQILLSEIRVKDTIDALVSNASFRYNQNDIMFQWAAPSFIDEKQTLYSYRLQGARSTNWSEPTTESMIRYMNLTPGKYKFDLKAIFPNGMYSDKSTSYSFEILPPWWTRWWVYVFVALAASGGVLLLARSYTMRRLEKQRLALEKQQIIEKERTRIASDMHDDLGAGLSSIRFLSEKIKQTSASDAATNEIGKIVNISSELVDNMNEIIWAMNEKNDTLEDLLFYTRSFAKEYCEENHIGCIDEFPDDIPSKFVSGEVRRNIFLTVKESLHNIVKHADATEVKLIVQTNELLTVIVSDNGKGIYLSDPYSYSGRNGLKNMQQRIESIGGRFILLNGDGVTIKLEVPLQKL